MMSTRRKVPRRSDATERPMGSIHAGSDGQDLGTPKSFSSKIPMGRPRRGGIDVPKFMDSHAMRPLEAETLRGLQNTPEDEFGVTHHDILFNEAENKVYCVLNAPDESAVRRHHEKAGIACDWVHEVESTRG